MGSFNANDASEPSVSIVNHRDCEEKLQQYEAGWKRALADYQNLQRETQEQRKALFDWCQLELLTQMLPIADHFDDALSHSPTNIEEGWLTGFKHIRKELEDLFNNHGAQAFGRAGETFDPAQHEALENQEGSPEQEHTIARVVSKGYRMNGKVLRPAKVVVFTHQ